jgi:hypothetical protein
MKGSITSPYKSILDSVETEFLQLKYRSGKEQYSCNYLLYKFLIIIMQKINIDELWGEYKNLQISRLTD